MPELVWLYQLADLLPFDCLQPVFMRRALAALILLAPLAAVMGIQVVGLRMAFFSDALSHSAFAGVALGLVLGVEPRLSMAVFGIVAGLALMAVLRRTTLPPDTVIAAVFAAILAGGLAFISRDSNLAGQASNFFYGDILTVTDSDVSHLGILFVMVLIFQALSFNHLIHIGLGQTLAKAHRVPVAACQYVFAALLALVVMVCVWSVGIFLVMALLVVPAATARNLARTAGAMFWWALLVGLTSAVIGLVLSAQPWMGTATGATIVLVACVWFALSLGVNALYGGRRV